jgi:hypothetical protein
MPINNVPGWWSEVIEGEADKLGREFKFHYKGISSKHPEDS